MNQESKRQIRMHQRIGWFKGILIPFLYSLFYFLLIFTTAMENAPEYLWLAFLWVPFLLGDVVYLLWRGAKFKRMAALQIQRWSCNFDPESKRIFWGMYLSRNWIISSGRFALCRANIKHHSHKEKYGKYGHTYYLVHIVTRSNETYHLRVSESEALQKIKKWLRGFH